MTIDAVVPLRRFRRRGTQQERSEPSHREREERNEDRDALGARLRIPQRRWWREAHGARQTRLGGVTATLTRELVLDADRNRGAARLCLWNWRDRAHTHIRRGHVTTTRHPVRPTAWHGGVFAATPRLGRRRLRPLMLGTRNLLTRAGDGEFCRRRSWCRRRNPRQRVLSLRLLHHTARLSASYLRVSSEPQALRRRPFDRAKQGRYGPSRIRPMGRSDQEPGLTWWGSRASARRAASSSG